MQSKMQRVWEQEGHVLMVLILVNYGSIGKRTFFLSCAMTVSCVADIDVLLLGRKICLISGIQTYL